MKICSVLLFAALTTLGFGQDLKSVVPQYKPGATLSYRVEFDGDPKFTAVSVSFSRQGPSSPNDQPGFAESLSLVHFVKVTAGVYSVDGQIPNNVRSGDYLLQEVDASIDQASKGYNSANMNVRIHVDNDARFDFPPLKSVKPN